MAALTPVSAAPEARISVTRTSVSCWRWPLVRCEECLRRRLTKWMTLSALICSITSACTAAPATSGRPKVGSSPPSIRMSLNWILSPASAASFSTRSTSPAWTLYCLPPVFRTANIGLPFSFPRPAAPALPALRPGCPGAFEQRAPGGASFAKHAAPGTAWTNPEPGHAPRRRPGYARSPLRSQACELWRARWRGDQSSCPAMNRAARIPRSREIAVNIVS